MSHHGLQVLYTLMNLRDDWVCERAFTPWLDMEAAAARPGGAALQPGNLHAAGRLRRAGLHAAIRNVVFQRADDARSGRDSAAQHRAHDGRSAGDCRRTLRQNPEPLAPFIDVFVTGDGEPSLPAICDTWLGTASARPGRSCSGEAGRQQREELLAELAARIAVRLRAPILRARISRDGRLVALHPTRPDVPATIEPAVIDDLDSDAAADAADRAVRRMRSRSDRDRDHARLPLAVPLLPEHGHQASAADPLGRNDRRRRRSRRTAHTGFHEISLLSLSTSDYPYFEQLVRRMHEVFVPLGVNDLAPQPAGQRATQERGRR